MAKKKVAAIVKIQIPAGKASPAPPVGTALGPHGVAIMDFVKAYNAATENQTGTIVPVDITIFEDRTFSFILKTPPTPVLLRERAGLEKASSEPGKTKVGRVTEAQVAEIAEIKMPDLNAYDLDAAKQQVRGTAAAAWESKWWARPAAYTHQPRPGSPRRAGSPIVWAPPRPGLRETGNVRKEAHRRRQDVRP